ncbi:SpvB/TcaC N-terminal domain-containing protein [Fodinibius sp.]|uniref:SpvB/TcaC N-terminal domain-containing protein n=1 Tax=Fodinibius sp. TaxID=1872440 RepID=UPI003561C855
MATFEKLNNKRERIRSGIKADDDAEGKQTSEDGGRASVNKNTGGISDSNTQNLPSISAPKLSLPKGGGSIRSIDEKFSINRATGTASLKIPIYTTSGRDDFHPKLSLSYDSGAGNGPFGIGWSLSVPSIKRKTAKGLPRYRDGDESDTFIMSGAEDLVPLLVEKTEGWKRKILTKSENGEHFKIYRYRPRTEGSFSRIERWVNKKSGEIHWRTTSKNNRTSIYGRSPESCIVDPKDPKRVFEWLIEETRDPKGNVIRYEYKQEDGRGVTPNVWEQHRLDNGSFAQLYPKRITYGNTVSHFEENWEDNNRWLFEVVFDYGEHSTADQDIPQYQKTKEWEVRSDPFSTYKPGFEVRTYRLCKRVLMFHRFDELENTPSLVRATCFGYEETFALTQMTDIWQTGYRYDEDDEEFKSKSLPSFEFSYSQPEVGKSFEYLEEESIENLPIGIDGKSYQWTDLDGEGLSGILTEKGGGWFYKRNLGGNRKAKSDSDSDGKSRGYFAPSKRVDPIPSNSQPGGKGQRLMDLEGDGQLDLVKLDNGSPGIYERTQDGGWKSFKPFTSIPNVDWEHPNLRFIDLTGDGKSDLLVTEDTVFTFYQSKGEEGYGSAEQVTKALDEEQGPTLIFNDATQSIFLADMSGDGLTDLVRIRNGEIVYWPNLGYAKFGAKITMGNAPDFARPDLFTHRRIKLGDVDGSGTTDVFYIGDEKVSFWFNQAGNSWSDRQEIESFPTVDDDANVQVMDLLGKGTSCLVWSSPLSRHSNQPMGYVDLMDQGKPHLLTSINNGMGLERNIHYAPSTKFYLEDREKGNPWKTRLPFPVHVVERTEAHEQITDTKYVTNYKYHHGYFDGKEREFHGFGLVESWDTDKFTEFEDQGSSGASGNMDEAHHRPPVYTKTWYHMGAFRIREAIARQFEDEYYDGDPDAVFLPDTSLPEDLSTEEQRQACRALKGHLLRKEIYAEDGSAEDKHPYRVVENAYKIKILQPTGKNRFAVFYPFRSEKLNYEYERNPKDPRLSHKLTLEVDNFGNVNKSAIVTYSRRQANGSSTSPKPEQQERQIRYIEQDYINKSNEVDFYRAGLHSESKKYEVTGMPDPSGDIYSLEELRTNIQNASKIDFEVDPSDGTLQKRLIEHQRILYYKDDLSGPLPLGDVESRALPYETYRLVFTPGIISKIYGTRVNASLLKKAGYTKSDGKWWIPSGHQEFDPSKFYWPVKFTDPFGNTYQSQYDKYSLLLEKTISPPPAQNTTGNEMKAINNYRVMRVQEIVDVNDNRSAVRFDALGMITATAKMDKDASEGDSLQGFRFNEPSDLDEAVQHPQKYLQSATSRRLVDLHRFKNGEGPVCTHTISRETHIVELSENEITAVQQNITYLDGLEREAMTKKQAEPGSAHTINDQGDLITVDTTPDIRWVGSGRNVYDNKGNPVKKYEPFFSVTHNYENEDKLVEWGVTPILHYDPLGRRIRTESPNGTFSKKELDSWKKIVWDTSDTVKESDWWQERQDPSADASESRAADLAAEHANTPKAKHLDALGRTFLSIADNGPEGKYSTHTELDAKGNPLVVTDAEGQEVMKHRYDLAGRKIYRKSMDSGERRLLPEVDDNPFRRWDAQSRQIEITYDALRRPTRTKVEDSSGNERTVEEKIYGEAQPNPKEKNLRDQVYKHRDGAGITITERYDFKGNAVKNSRTLTKKSNLLIDWSDRPELENKQYVVETFFDALDRPIAQHMPDGSVIEPGYNEAGVLEQIDCRLRGESASTTFVRNIDYNAKGQRTRIQYNNGVSTKYTYDDQTFRLINLLTTRSSDGKELQNLHFTYDPVGNITEIANHAEQDTYFQNSVVSPDRKYEYDALYRLTKEEGRELARSLNAAQPADEDLPPKNLPHSNNTQALHRYEESYSYDKVGNLLTMAHKVLGGADPQLNWKRHYQYEQGNNRLRSTSLPGDTRRPEDNAGGTYSAVYTHDSYGNMTSMPHLNRLEWNYEDQLRKVDLGGGGKVHFSYGSGGQRVRKVHDHNGITEERIYLDGFEIYRRFENGSLKRRRESLHIMDDKKRVALVETKTHDNGSPIENPNSLQRYQLGNHLETVSLEVDEAGNIITYEEYFPFGGTSYRAGRSTTEVSLKRYRYTGKEHDESTGLYYHGARYYAAWLGRWTSADPIGLKGGINSYGYVRNNPVRRTDPSGTQDEDEIQGGFGITLDTGGNVSLGPLDASSECDSMNPACGPLIQMDSTPEDELQIESYLIFGDPGSKSESDQQMGTSGEVSSQNPTPEPSRSESQKEEEERPWGSYLPGTEAGEEAAQYYADLVVEGGKQGGFTGFLKQTAGWTGGLFASLWTPETAIDTALTLGTAGIGTGVNVGARASQSAAFGLRGFFIGRSSYQATRSAYWGARAGGAEGAGATLHHWLIPQRLAASRGGFVPDRVVNAGWNLLELPNMTGLVHRSLGLNQYMGFAMNWGPRNIFWRGGIPKLHHFSQHQLKAYFLEQGLRGGILSSPFLGFGIGGYAGTETDD